MNRAKAGAAVTALPKPRTCGDEPQAVFIIDTWMPKTPHMRG